MLSPSLSSRAGGTAGCTAGCTAGATIGVRAVEPLGVPSPSLSAGATTGATAGTRAVEPLGVPVGSNTLLAGGWHIPILVSGLTFPHSALSLHASAPCLVSHFCPISANAWIISPVGVSGPKGTNAVEEAGAAAPLDSSSLDGWQVPSTHIGLVGSFSLHWASVPQIISGGPSISVCPGIGGKSLTSGLSNSSSE